MKPLIIRDVEEGERFPSGAFISTGRIQVPSIGYYRTTRAEERESHYYRLEIPWPFRFWDTWYTWGDRSLRVYGRGVVIVVAFLWNASPGMPELRFGVCREVRLAEVIHDPCTA